MRLGMKPADVAQKTSPETRSRWRRHSSCATGPPIEYPTAITGPVSSSSERRRAVVGAVGEPEHPARAQALAVTAEVRRDHPEAGAEMLERLEPVEATGRGPAVQEEKGRGARGPGDLADEGPAPARKVQVASRREPGTRETFRRPPDRFAVDCQWAGRPHRSLPPVQRFRASEPQC